MATELLYCITFLNRTWQPFLSLMISCRTTNDLPLRWGCIVYWCYSSSTWCRISFQVQALLHVCDRMLLPHMFFVLIAPHLALLVPRLHPYSETMFVPVSTKRYSTIFLHFSCMHLRATCLFTSAADFKCEMIVGEKNYDDDDKYTRRTKNMNQWSRKFSPLLHAKNSAKRAALFTVRLSLLSM